MNIASKNYFVITFARPVTFPKSPLTLSPALKGDRPLRGQCQPLAAQSPIFSLRLFPGSCGFSLVEVTLALGIVTFALVSIMGLFSVGLGLFRQAIDTSIQGQITQKVLGSVHQTDFSRLNTAKSYFDDQGKEVTSASDISNKKYLYEAAITVQNPTQLPSSLPNTSSTNLATVRVIITTLSNPAYPFQYSTVVASNGS